MTELDHLYSATDAWKVWKSKFKITLTDEKEAQKNFEENHKFILDHNLSETTFKLAHNQYSHLNNMQYLNLLKGFKKPEKRLKVHYLHDENVQIPSGVNWVSKGVVNEVQNQGQCGSCYAFSSTAAIESQVAINEKKLVKLSEQNAMDGSSNGYGNYGGNGGYMDNVFDYVKDFGLGLESDYPYQAKAYAGTLYDVKNKAAGLTGYVDLPEGSEHALTVAIGSVGPVSIGIDASQRTFQFYSSGIYYDPRTSPKNIDHAVVAVGYGTVNNQDYYIVRNSWGSSWGQKGYVLMRRNMNNAAGIASMASYPTGCYLVKK